MSANQLILRHAPACGAGTFPGLPASRNFLWALTGNTVFATCQWGMIIALAKAGNTAMVGQFSLGIAIATPILMFSNFDLRAVQSTDADREFCFADYLRLRLAMTLSALMIVGAIAFLGGYDRRAALVIAAVGLAKGIETLSDIHYGLFQLNGRLDQTGRSMILRGVSAVAAMTAVLIVSHNLLYGCVAMTAAWLSILCLFDVRQARALVAATERARNSRPHLNWRRLWRLARIALPMGIVTTIASLNLQMPRYFVHARLGDQALGVFSALAYATVAMTLVGDSLGHCTIPRLSRLYADRRFVAFSSLLTKLFVIGVAIGACGVAAAQLFGKRLLNVFYSPEYAAQSRVFLLLIVAAAIHFVASMLTSGLTSSRHFRIQVPLYLTVTGCTALACARLVPELGLAGGALGVMVGAIVRLILVALVARYLWITRGICRLGRAA